VKRHHRRKTGSLWIAGALGSTVAVLAAAQPAAAQDTPAGCELHVWPSSPVRSSSNNYFVMRSIVDGAVQGRDGYAKLPENILTAEAQVRTLGELDLPALLQLPDHRVVFHEEALPSRTIRTTRTRLIPASPPCYAELVTDDVFYQQDAIDGRHLKAIFRFRQFDGGSDAPARSFGTFVQYRLTKFPPEAPEQLDAALEEFRLAYGEAAKEFGAALNKPAKGKKSKPKN
jgi:hypothetical protein